MPYGIRSPVQARRLSIPDTYDPIASSSRHLTQELRPPHSRRRQLLIYARLEDHPFGAEQLGISTDLQIKPSERRPWISADKHTGIQAPSDVKPTLRQQHPDHRLDASEQHRAAQLPVSVLESHHRGGSSGWLRSSGI